MTQEKVEQAVGLIREHNKDAHIITTPWDNLKAEDIIKAMEGDDMMESLLEEIKKHHDEEHEHHHHHHEEGEECHCHDEGHEHHHHHHADEVFTSIGIESPVKYTEDELKAILEKLANTDEYGIVLRAKGMVPDVNSDKFLHFDLTPGEYEIRHGSPEYTGRVCVIGSKIKEDTIKELFK